MPQRAAHTPAYESVDLTTCDREPIHVPGAIQPHGVLLALSADALEIVVASRNTVDAWGIEAVDLIGRPLAAAVGAAAAAEISGQLDIGDLSEPMRRTLEHTGGAWAGRMIDIVVHRSADRVVVELEPVGSATGVSAVSYRSARAAMTRLTATHTIKELCDQLAREIRAVTGFDRVMVYRFDEQWNGEVVAEDRRDDLNAFLGLHYPASDIPAQARRLYTVNWTRLIADVGYTPVPLVPVLDPATDAPLDLSHSVLRSVSPIHLEYLGNMGVTASMSVSLVSDGVLTGLVACHHYSGPHRPSYDSRSAAEFLGQTASHLVDARERSDARGDALAAQAVLAEITSHLAQHDQEPLTALIADTRLLSLFDAAGAALWTGGAMETLGDVPDDAALHQIARALERGDGSPVASHHLAGLSPDLVAHAQAAAGALRIGWGPDRWLLWVRRELEQVVDWGGDPTNKSLAAAEGPDVRLSPRKSFAKWRQVVHGRSEPWTTWQIQAADGLRNLLNSLMLRRSREQATIAESLQRSVVLADAPDFAGLEVLGRYRPAEGSQLGGDWWDAFERDDGRIVFVVGDVAGHGVQAATAMTQLRTALRAYVADGHSARECLDRLDHLMGSLLEGRTATVVIATVDVAGRTVEVASAGHVPPLLVTSEEAAVVDVPLRPLLGVGIGGARSVTVSLTEGGIVLLYSDGVVERRGTSIDQAIERLRVHATGGPGDTSLAAWVDGLLAAFPGTEHDDTTLVAIRL